MYTNAFYIHLQLYFLHFVPISGTLLQPSDFPRGWAIAAFLRILPSFNSPDLEPLHIFYIAFRSILLCYILVGLSKSPNLDRENVLRSRYATTTETYKAMDLGNGFVLLLGPCY